MRAIPSWLAVGGDAGTIKEEMSGGHGRVEGPSGGFAFARRCSRCIATEGENGEINAPAGLKAILLDSH
jgi:hypothetical protein